VIFTYFIKIRTLNVYNKKNCVNVFLIFFNCIDISILLTFIEEKTKKLETENVRKQFKTNSNILNILSCIENANINN